MSEYIYSEEDRKRQLVELVEALKELIPLAGKLDLHQTADYENALARSGRLLAEGFTQKELSTLSRSVPDVFHRHRDWESSILVEGEDGSLAEPEWFRELEEKLQPVLKAAAELSVMGYY